MNYAQAKQKFLQEYKGNIYKLDDANFKFFFDEGKRSVEQESAVDAEARRKISESKIRHNRSGTK